MSCIVLIAGKADDREAAVAREIERLKQRVIWSERAGGDSWRQISFLYRSADRFDRLYSPGVDNNTAAVP